MPTIIGEGNRRNSPGVVGRSKDGESVHGESHSATSPSVVGIATNTDGTGAGVLGQSHGKGAGVSGTSSQGEGVRGETSSRTAAAIAGINLNTEGFGPGVYGESRGRGPAALFNGDVEVTGLVRLVNADCAEEFDVAEADLVEAGMVMVLDDGGILKPGCRAYDKRVAGVVSGAGSYKPASVLDKQASRPNRKPVALVGKVYCKVDARYGAVETGDLLTTSPTLGHAMKVSDRGRAFGAVIGKALRPLAEGQELIPILVCLQ